jgi:hypothetical protein
MSYFATFRITDVNGNVVELKDTSETMDNILLELKSIHKILEEIAEIKVSKEDIDDGN